MNTHTHILYCYAIRLYNKEQTMIQSGTQPGELALIRCIGAIKLDRRPPAEMPGRSMGSVGSVGSGWIEGSW